MSVGDILEFHLAPERMAHLARLAEGGYSCVLFNALTGDWQDRDGWVARGLAEIAARPWTTLVLHDIAGGPGGSKIGAMQRLEEFLDQLAEAGHEIVQMLDAECMPMRRGKITQSMDHLIS